MQQKALLAAGLIMTCVLVPMTNAGPAYGAALTVTNTADTADGICDAHCSLREAIYAANLAPDRDTITFNIPSLGPHTIRVATHLGITYPVTIDGYTQPGSRPNSNPVTSGLNPVLNIELDGSDAGPNYNGLWVSRDANGSIIQGLLIRNFPRAGIFVNATDVSVRGNFILNSGIGVDIDWFVGFQSRVTVGGPKAADANLIASHRLQGISLYGGGDNTIEGNWSGGNGTDGIRLEDSWDGNIIRNNVSDSNGWAGIVAFDRSQRMVIAGNQVTANGSHGIAIASHTYDSSFDSVISSNTVEGSAGVGIVVTASSRTKVLGNFIRSNGAEGVNIGNSEGNSVGGVSSGEGNVISLNRGPGILVGESTATIRGNSVYSNSSIGIDNIQGGNLELAPPVVLTAGSASGTACPNCVVDVYSDQEDEGEIYHGSTVADASGNWIFAGVVQGPNLTATATDAAGNTSEFSAPLCIADADSDGICDPADNCPSYANANQTDGDVDDVGDPCDNCPSHQNTDQQNSDNDGLGDACDSDDDNDLFVDAAELSCGSDPLSAASIPERTDILSDDDLDGQVNEALPFGSAPYDCDGDGFIGSIEKYVFSAANTTSDQKKCGVNAWPTDINNDGFVDMVGDISAVTNYFGQSVPPAPARYNIAPDGFIDILGDISRMTGVFGQSCAP